MEALGAMFISVLMIYAVLLSIFWLAVGSRAVRRINRMVLKGTFGVIAWSLDHIGDALKWLARKVRL